MPEICENWLGLVNICVYYAYYTCEIYQVLPYLLNRFRSSQGVLKSTE